MAMSPNLIKYLTAARDAGCPRDQIERFVDAGIVLSQKQLLASAAARLCDRDDGPSEIGYGGARGGGKSHWLVGQMGADDAQRLPGYKGLILRKVGKAGRESFEDLRLKVLAGLPHKYTKSGALEFENGSRIILGHYQNETDIDAYLGLEYDGIGIEEATTLTASKVRSISTCCRTSKRGWRPRIYNTTNPGNVGHGWFKKKFIDPWRRREETATRFIPATVDDNRFVNREYMNVLNSLTGWQKRAWRYGDWDIQAGQFFTTWRDDVHKIEPFAVPESWRKWCALDYGFTHFTSCGLFTQSDDGDTYMIAEHGERRWLPSRHAESIKGMLSRFGIGLGDLDEFVAGADVFAVKGKGRTIADDYADEGITLTPANTDRINGAGAILNLLGDWETGITPRLFVFDTCVRTLEQIPAMVHDEHRPEDVLKVNCDDDGEGGDDFYDMFRYGVMAKYESQWSWT